MSDKYFSSFNGYKVKDADARASIEKLNEDYIGEASGSSVVVDDVSPIAHELGVTVESKNFFDLSSIIGKSNTANGGTLTCNNDGGITGSGTPTGYVSFGGTLTTLPKGIATFSASGNFSNISFDAHLFDANNVRLVTVSVGDSVGSRTINMADYPTFHHYTYEIKRRLNNVEMSGTAYFQIEADDTATEYTPFVDVEGVKVTRTGKNLLDLSSAIGKTYNSNGGTLTVGADGGITGSGTPTGTVATSFKLNVPKDKLTLSASGTFTNIQCSLYLYDAAATLLKTITVTETAREATINVTDYPTFSYARIDIKRKSNGVEMSGTAYFQLEHGGTATEYEQYNGQTATAAADGNVTGLKSLASCMTLFSDTEGVILNVEYCKDYYNSIIQAETRAKEYAKNLLSNIAMADCTTAANVAAKEITVREGSTWELKPGAIVAVKFANSNTAGSSSTPVTLNVNGTGAYPIWYNNAKYTNNSTTVTGSTNRVITYVFDGEYYVWLSAGYMNSPSQASLGQGYGTCSTEEATTAKVVTLSNYTLATGGIVSVKFDNAVPANATMNINSRGAKAIYYRGSAITDGIIKAGDIATFIYNGTQYHLIAIDRWQEDIDDKISKTGGTFTLGTLGASMTVGEVLGLPLLSTDSERPLVVAAKGLWLTNVLNDEEQSEANGDLANLATVLVTSVDHLSVTTDGDNLKKLEIADPTNDSHATTKNYVDTAVQTVKDRRSTIVIGSSANGYTEADCDYLCDGTADQVEINEAIQDLAATGGAISFLPGIYTLSGAVLLDKAYVILDGCGARFTGKGTFMVTGAMCVIRNCNFANLENTNESAVIYLNAGSSSGTEISSCNYSSSANNGQWFIIAQTGINHIINCSSIGSVGYNGGIRLNCPNNTVSNNVMQLYYGSKNPLLSSENIGIYVNSNGNVISGNNLYTSHGFVIKVEMANNIITNNYIKTGGSTGQYGIYNINGNNIIANNIIDAYDESHCILKPANCKPASSDNYLI